VRFTSFNSGWEFRPKVSRFLERGGRAPAHRSVTLPHDTVIESERTPESGGATGFFPGGVFEYRKTFSVPEEYRDKRVAVGEPVHIAWNGVRVTTTDVDRYELDRKLFPHRVIMGSETHPTRIDRLWRLVLDNSHVFGDFTWTGWDYLGEAGVGRTGYADEDSAPGQGIAGTYPWLTARTGDIDITGHRRAPSYYREIVYGLRTEPYITVHRPENHGRGIVAGPWSWPSTVASWSWDGAEGDPVRVDVYSDAEEVELYLDGVPVGRAPAGPRNRYQATFDVIYRPGEPVAVALTDGRERGRAGWSRPKGRWSSQSRPTGRVSVPMTPAWRSSTSSSPPGTATSGAVRTVPSPSTSPVPECSRASARDGPPPRRRSRAARTPRTTAGHSPSYGLPEPARSQ
jgi:hypothetical protein